MNQWKAKVDFYNPLRNRSLRYTRDFQELKRIEAIPFFFADNFQIGGRLHKIIAGSTYLGEGITAMQTFQLRRPTKQSDDLPMDAMIRKYRTGEEPTSARGQITGDIFLLDPVTACEVDEVMGNTIAMSRGRQWIWALDQKARMKGKGKPALECMTYTMNMNFWKDRNTYGLAFKVKDNGRKIWSWDVEDAMWTEKDTLKKDRIPF